MIKCGKVMVVNLVNRIIELGNILPNVIVSL